MKSPVGMLLAQKGGEVVTVEPSLNVAEAVRVMNEHKIGSVVVCSDNTVEGIFTERDVLTRVVAAGRNPYVTAVRDVMTGDLATIGPNESLADAMQVFAQRRCRHLPVVSGHQLLGLISIGDISRWLLESHRVEAEHLRAYISGELVH